MKLRAFALLLAAACGGHAATEATPDAAVPNSTGACSPDDAGGACIGDPNCCLDLPFRGNRIDLTRECSESPQVAVACYPPAAKPGQHCGRPTTGDIVCFVRLSTGEVFRSADDLFGQPGFALCDDATKAAVVNVHDACP